MPITYSLCQHADQALTRGASAHPPGNFGTLTRPALIQQHQQHTHPARPEEPIRPEEPVERGLFLSMIFWDHSRIPT
jgi:hypothetical protein